MKRAVLRQKSSGINFNILRHGSTDCEVRFRMPRAVFERVMAFYGKAHNWFATCEIYRQPCGWYAVYGRNDVVNGAMRIIHLISTALGRSKKSKDTATETTPTAIKYQTPRTRLLVRKIQVANGRRPQAIAFARCMQVCRDVLQRELSSARTILTSVLMKERLGLSVGIQQLQQKFGH